MKVTESFHIQGRGWCVAIDPHWARQLAVDDTLRRGDGFAWKVRAIEVYCTSDYNPTGTIVIEGLGPLIPHEDDLLFRRPRIDASP